MSRVDAAVDDADDDVLAGETEIGAKPAALVQQAENSELLFVCTW